MTSPNSTINNKKDKSVNSADTKNTHIYNIKRSTVNNMLTVNNNKPDSYSYNNIVREIVNREKEKEFDIDYYEVLYGETKVIGIRVPLIYYKMYKKRIAPNHILRRVFRDTVIELIKTYSKNIALIEAARQAEKTINVNVSPNVIINKIENNVKAESRAEVNIDIDSILSEIAKLKQLIGNWRRVGLIPPAAYDSAASTLKNIEKKLARVN